MTKIIPKYVNVAQAGKKYGSVVHQDGTKFLVKQEHMGSFGKGVEIEIETRTENWGSGPVTIAAPAVTQAPAPSPTPAQNGNGTYTNGNHSGNKDEHIFTCGVVNNWLAGAQGRKPSAQDIVDVTNAARDAYRQTLGARA